MQMDIDIIEIEWEGPLKVKDVVQLEGGADYGLYQIYGTHNVLGPDCLLYIGKAGPFAARIRAHEKEWIEWEAKQPDVYVGRLGGMRPMTEDKWPEWEDLIDRAERLLIYFCAPPYNSTGLKKYEKDGKTRETVVLNFKKRHRLPLMVSTLYENSDVSKENGQWKTYGSEPDASAKPPSS